MEKRLTFLPNLITVLRMILTVPFLAMLAGRLGREPGPMPAAPYIVLALICLSDLFDGAAARGLKAESALGSALDVAADGLFIFSSLVVFNLLDVVPVWFTAAVLADFLWFLATSRVLTRTGPAPVRTFFVFDGAGRTAAVLYYLVPAAACAVCGDPGSRGLSALLHAMLFSAVLLSAVSLPGRFLSCFCALRDAARKKELPEPK